ncbi:MAG: DUF368 domain-containing protein [Cytophagales bacterium]|nr:DUF368 domain-containing protein [Cytophagales bacterium]
MQYLILVLKGMAMGAANVIPGVSGGTIAFITGIYERLIAALKSIDLTAIKLLFTGQWKEFAEYIDFKFLFFLFLGVGVSILSLAKILAWALAEEEVFTMAFFFGLILASILGVGKQIGKSSVTTISSFIVGLGIALGIALLPPAATDDSMVYVFLCGVVAVCSMILPGLSGAYLLLLMGNYILVLTAINSFDFGILLPLIVGVLIGLILFSRLLAWLFDHFKAATISMLTGFVVGSLLIIWPWKKTVYSTILGSEKAVGYEWFLPSMDASFLVAFFLVGLGFMIVWWMDRYSTRQVKDR